MTIIVEGGDRVGKSTVCRYLMQKGHSYYHFDYPRSEDVVKIYDDYFKLNSSNANVKDFVYDRALFSEYAYSRYYGRKSNMTIEQLNRLEKMFKSHDPDNYAVILYLENDINENLRLLEDEGEGKITKIEDILKLRKLYYEALSYAYLPVFTFNYQF